MTSELNFDGPFAEAEQAELPRWTRRGPCLSIARMSEEVERLAGLMADHLEENADEIVELPSHPGEVTDAPTVERHQATLAQAARGLDFEETSGDGEG